MSSILVLGGGPAGYVAALRAAQLGAQVTLVEERQIGGTCLNRGCIPTKTLVAAVERLRQARAGIAAGFLRGELQADFAALMDHKTAVTDQLRGGVEHLLKARQVDVVGARGRLAGPGAVLLDDGRTLTADAVILATGSEPVLPQLFRVDDERVLTSDGLLDLAALPGSLAIVGGGVIGSEFAAIFAELGVKVTVIEMLDQLLPGEDKRAGRALQQAFRKAGINVELGKPVVSVAGTGAGVTLGLGDASGAEVTVDLVLVAIGRRALSRDLGYEEAGVTIDERGFVVVDETLRTSVPGVFAAGDLAGPPLLAHWAYHEGAIAAENAVTGSSLTVDRRVVPNCVFSHPEVASVGLSEAQAAADGVTVAVAAVRFNGNSKAVVEGEAEGFVRIVYDPATGIVLGACLVGPRVTELVHEIGLAVRERITLDGLAGLIHAHPTLSEAVGEVALAALGRGLHTL